MERVEDHRPLEAPAKQNALFPLLPTPFETHWESSVEQKMISLFQYNPQAEITYQSMRFAKILCSQPNHRW
jgi:hypothetical protein